MCPVTDRPDSRLLLPASAVPDGARVWLRDGRGPYAVVHSWDTVSGRVYTLAECGAPSSLVTRPAADLLVDLSAPVDGERLDARAHFLRELHPEAARLTPSHVPCRWNVRMDGGDTLLYVVGPDDEMAYRHIRVDPWPDLSGLTPGDAARAVVVAALVARGGARG